MATAKKGMGFAAAQKSIAKKQGIPMKNAGAILAAGARSASTSAKKWDAELNAYSAARKQGIQPAGTSMAKVQEAVEKSNKAGKAYDANTGGFKG